MTAHGKDGEVVIGANPYNKTETDAEVATQRDLINQIATALEGKVANTGTDTSDATATAGDILSGKTAYVDGEKITGTIVTQAAQTITPGTSNKTIASGRYLTGTQTIKGDANLVAGNIKSGVSIFGVSGTYTGDDLDSVITELETKVSTLNTTLDGKAGGGGSSDGGSSLATYRVRYDDGGMCNLCYYVTLNNGILQIIPLGTDQLYGDDLSTDFEVDGVVEGGTFAVQCGDSIDATCTNAELLNVYEDITWGNYIYTYLITGDAEIIG